VDHAAGGGISPARDRDLAIANRAGIIATRLRCHCQWHHDRHTASGIMIATVAVAPNPGRRRAAALDILPTGTATPRQQPGGGVSTVHLI